jgi:hypothetical protein
MVTRVVKVSDAALKRALRTSKTKEAPQMRRIFFTAIVALLALIAGCYFPETIETRIVFNDNDLPTVIINYHNISSSEEEREDLKESFDEMIKDMYGDEYLVDQAE